MVAVDLAGDVPGDAAQIGLELAQSPVGALEMPGMGEKRLQALLQESLAVATRTGAMKPGDLARVIVDTTVQPKNITFPTEAKLMNRAREKLVTLARRSGFFSPYAAPV